MVPVNSLVELQLLEKFNKGDEKAFDYFYQTYSLSIYRMLLKMVKVDVIAQELLQDVFVRIWEKRHLIDPQQPFKSYLFRIARNISYDFYRKLGNDDKLQNEVRKHVSEVYSHIEEDLYLKETEQFINDVIDQLPKKQKQVFVLCKIEGKSYEEVSTLLGISISTVNGHIVNATKILKHAISQKETLILYAVLLKLSIELSAFLPN
jgi:RNA polymerase sigma-70 factor (family 1)